MPKGIPECSQCELKYQCPCFIVDKAERGCSFQSCSTDEPSDDTNGVTNEVDNAPILNTSPEQLPNVPMYTDTDYEQKSYYPPPSYFVESPPPYSTVVCDDRSPQALLDQLQPEQRPLRDRNVQSHHYRSRHRTPSRREILWNIKAGIGLTLCCLLCFFPAMLCTVSAVILYFVAYKKVNQGSAGAGKYCTVAFYLNVTAVISGTILSIPFIGVVLRLIVFLNQQN